MAGKKSVKPEKSDAEKALEHRVDVIMGAEETAQAAAVSIPVTKKKVASKKAPAKAPKGPKTAPPLVITLADEPKEVAAQTPIQAMPDPEEDAAPAPEPPAETEWAQDPDPEDDPLENSDTDEAVDEIVAKESDAILALDDALAARKERLSEPVEPRGMKHKWLWFLVFIIVVGTVVDYLIFKSH